MTVIALHRAKFGLPAFELRPAEVAEPLLEDDPPWERIELTEQPRFAALCTLYAQDLSGLQRAFSKKLVNMLERDPGWCLEGLCEWFITYRAHRSQSFWSLPRGKFESVLAPKELSARIRTAHHLFGLVTEGS
jgi:hypothetical protein